MVHQVSVWVPLLVLIAGTWTLGFPAPTPGLPLTLLQRSQDPSPRLPPGAECLSGCPWAAVGFPSLLFSFLYAVNSRASQLAWKGCGEEQELGV